jgi:Fe-S cluster assembly protein SufD
MNEAMRLFSETYQREQAALPGAKGWLGEAREKAIGVFAENGLPHRRVEAWRYTDLRRVLDQAAFMEAPAHVGAVLPDAMHRAFENISAHTMVFVNGLFRPELSKLSDLPIGVEIFSLRDVWDTHWVRAALETQSEKLASESIASLNLALAHDGAAIRIGRDTIAEKPLHLLYLSADNGSCHTRNVVVLEEGSEATIFETHVAAGADKYFSNLLTHIDLGMNAKLTHIGLQNASNRSVHVSSADIRIGRDAKLIQTGLTLGAEFSREQSFVTFSAEGGEADLNTAYALRGEQHADRYCFVDHAVPRCRSSVFFRGVMDNEAEGTFQGHALVRENAQKTDARQLCNVLLLSRGAAMNAKPELEIYADDVQCAHGATIGELSEQSIFYMRSRGIDEKAARSLLIAAFLDEVVERVPHDVAREALQTLVSGWFGEAA